jgi:DNA repair protein RecO
MKPTSYTTKGLVLRRVNTGETDRIVTVLTQEQGKIACVAKGVRKMTSTNRAYLEPGTLLKMHLVPTRSLPIITQTSLIDDTSKMRQDLHSFRQLSQILEIIDTLFVEAEIDEATYLLAIKLRNQVVYNQVAASHIRSLLVSLIVALGFQDPNLSVHETITEYLQTLSGKPLRSFDFLKVE